MVAKTSRGGASTREDAGRTLVISRVIDAPRALVFKVWSQPEHLARWFGPEDHSVPTCEMDFRPGGAYFFVLRSAAGKEHRLKGVYREIDPPKRLAFTWAWVDAEGSCSSQETLVELTFEEEGDKTRLTLRQALFESSEARDAHNEGWSSSLNSLERYLAGL
jgi:uncharacterized protein YndB with AHSA1/START domain